MQVQVCETFISIQGESTWAGMPCFFIRLAGCNLHCVYCDTGYAQSGGEPATVSELVEKFRKTGLGLVAVTGGEPLIQPGTTALLQELQSCGTVLIETNGSRDISGIPPAVIAVMDIKCPSSGESEATDWKNMQRLRPRDEVKFVVGGREDYLWASGVMREHDLTKRCQAVLMSPVSDLLAPAELAAWILRDRLPVRLNLQLHKIIWSPTTRGV
ncbi:MAG: radical SAM protein [Verrucomicrobia bacterium]|nr:radical SAM protein [Verrucomicrobiota bacterium]MCG2680173.1 radical SAM protein [Kiritimatiellia bacterium]MBU4247492.1 radical SAM protein [Verrucomicrobiota bacterium]MBU4289461.1 radical SAM protein [Verrucomicrobiota bacterium]MBU4429626.1 radical SAM protein [Verrucomicrobiota bacterium]